MSARRAPGPAVRLHRWCGLSVGLLLVLVALTGAGMAFRPQLDPVLNAPLLRVPACAAPLAPARLVAVAQAANAGAGPLTAIRMYADPHASTRVRFSDGRWVYLDPCSARVLGIQDAYGGLFGTLAWLHIFGYLPSGDIAAGVCALAMIALSGVGAWLWWRGRVPVSAGRKRVLAPAARRCHLHRRIGPWAAPGLLLLGLTGLPQAFPTLAGALQQLGAGSASLAAGAPAVSTPGAVPLDTIMKQVARQPWSYLQWRMPAAGQDSIVVEITAADAPHAYAAGTARFDPASGALLLHNSYEQTTAGRKAWQWALALHYGAVGGPAWQLLLFLSALAVPLLAWTGIASYLHRRRIAQPAPTLQLRLRNKQMEASGVCSFEFVHPRGRRLPPWTAGAHVDVYVAPGIVRQYSLCADPRDRYRYLIAVHRCEPSRGGSRAMHEVLREGQVVALGLPRNHFALAPHAGHSILLAGGIGITPMLAMAESLAAAEASFELHYCARSAGHAAFDARLAEDRFEGRVHRHFSSGGQRLDMDGLLATPGPDAHLYICGPSGFTDAAVEAAMRQGWDAANVHTERFSAAGGSGGLGAAAGAPGVLGAAFELEIASTGRLVHVPEHQSALDALLEAGIAIPTSCGQGICGACVTGILEGEPEHRDNCLPPETRAANNCFSPCCSRARSPRLVLDL